MFSEVASCEYAKFDGFKGKNLILVCSVQNNFDRNLGEMILSQDHTDPFA